MIHWGHQSEKKPHHNTAYLRRCIKGLWPALQDVVGPRCLLNGRCYVYSLAESVRAMRAVATVRATPSHSTPDARTPVKNTCEDFREISPPNFMVGASQKIWGRPQQGRGMCTQAPSPSQLLLKAQMRTPKGKAVRTSSFWTEQSQTHRSTMTWRETLKGYVVVAFRAVYKLQGRRCVPSALSPIPAIVQQLLMDSLDSITLSSQVLRDLGGDSRLDEFRSQYEKVLQAVRRSHGP